jgi:hypothetical protein
MFWHCFHKYYGSADEPVSERSLFLNGVFGEEVSGFQKSKLVLFTLVSRDRSLRPLRIVDTTHESGADTKTNTILRVWYQCAALFIGYLGHPPPIEHGSRPDELDSMMISRNQILQLQSHDFVQPSFELEAIMIKRLVLRSADCFAARLRISNSLK